MPTAAMARRDLMESPRTEGCSRAGTPAMQLLVGNPGPASTALRACRLGKDYAPSYRVHEEGSHRLAFGAICQVSVHNA